MMHEIITISRLPFAREHVWAVLVDFGSYAEWNPIDVHAHGVAVEGASVRMRYGRARNSRHWIAHGAVITCARSGRALSWVSSYPLLFRGERFFELHGDEGYTDLVHGERLSGLIPRFWKTEKVEELRLAFEAMNTALAERLHQLFIPFAAI